MEDKDLTLKKTLNRIIIAVVGGLLVLLIWNIVPPSSGIKSNPDIRLKEAREHLEHAIELIESSKVEPISPQKFAIRLRGHLDFMEKYFVETKNCEIGMGLKGILNVIIEKNDDLRECKELVKYIEENCK